MNEEALKATGYGLNYHSSISDKGDNHLLSSRSGVLVHTQWYLVPFKGKRQNVKIPCQLLLPFRLRISGALFSLLYKFYWRDPQTQNQPQ